MRQRRVLVTLGTLAMTGLLGAMLLSAELGYGEGTNTITSPDTDGDVGKWTSLALDASGHPVVSYNDWTNHDLKVMHCDDPNCSGSDESITSPDSEGDVGYAPSLALDALGNPVVAYCGGANNSLKVLHCNDPNCSGGDESVTSPDTSGDGCAYSSLALDASGNPAVSYYAGGDLKVLHCNDPSCSGGDESITSPDTDGTVGRENSLVLDGAGNPVVSYCDDTHRHLKVLHCNDPNCGGGDESITSPDMVGWVGRYTSLALDGSGNPVVSYQDWINMALKILHCNDPNCGGGDESITSPDMVGGFDHRIQYEHTSLTLDASGSPVVSYHEINKTLKILRCNDPNCSGGDESITSPDSASATGWYTSVALDALGNPVVSYYDASNRDLKLLHCGDAVCTAKPTPTSTATLSITATSTPTISPTPTATPTQTLPPVGGAGAFPEIGSDAAAGASDVLLVPIAVAGTTCAAVLAYVGWYAQRSSAR